MNGLLLHEILACAGFTAAFLVLFAAGEILRRVCRWNPEVTRKTIHLAGCLIAMLFPVFLHTIWSVLVLSCGFALLLLVAPRFNLLHAVNDVERSSSSVGGFTHPLAIFICYFFAWRLHTMVFYEIAMLVLAFSDSSAALTGMAYGRRKYLVEGESRKSIEGSVIFFMCTFFIVEIMLLLFTALTRIDCILLALLIAVLVTHFEAISLHGTDNLFVPLGTVFILAKNMDPSTEKILFQFEALIATFAIAAVLAYPYRKITRPGLVAVGLGIYTGWGLVGYAWALPMFAALLIVCRTDWIMPEPEDADAACRVRASFYLAVVPVIWLLAANLTWKLTGKDIEPIFYPGFLAAIAGQLMLSRQRNRTAAGIKDKCPRLLADTALLWAGLHATGFFVFGAAHVMEWCIGGALAFVTSALISVLCRPVLLREWDETSQRWYSRVRMILVLALTFLPNAVLFCIYGKRFLE
ncbi:MAG: hypothetical protein IKP09_05775 [Lentisphaeria bacterium]|nr:hypothetical protein [Lentisphaeria bacterium]